MLHPYTSPTAIPNVSNTFFFFSRAKLNNLIASTGRNPYLPQPPAAGDREGPELPLLLCALTLIVFAKRQRAPSSGNNAPHQSNEDPL